VKYEHVVVYINSPGGSLMTCIDLMAALKLYKLITTIAIGEAVKFILKTDDVAVSINAKHYCVISRGVEDQGSNTITNYLCGAYRNDSMTRSEFMAMVSN
jgi:GTP cyclohydrolase I